MQGIRRGSISQYRQYSESTRGLRLNDYQLTRFLATSSLSDLRSVIFASTPLRTCGEIVCILFVPNHCSLLASAVAVRHDLFLHFELIRPTNQSYHNPPVTCANILTDEDARLSTQKLLQKWRPDVLEEKKPPPSPPQPESTPQPSPSGTAATTNGIKSATANNIAPTSNGVTKGETITGGGGLEIADTGGSKTERGGSVVAAVG